MAQVNSSYGRLDDTTNRSEAWCLGKQTTKKKKALRMLVGLTT